MQAIDNYHGIICAELFATNCPSEKLTYKDWQIIQVEEISRNSIIFDSVMPTI